MSLIISELRAEGVEVGEAFLQIALKAAGDRGVEGWSGQVWREVILAGKGVGLVVIVKIALAVSVVFHEGCGRVEDLFWWRQVGGFLSELLSFCVGGVGCVGFWAEGEIDGCLGKEKFSLFGAEAADPFPGSEDVLKGVRVGKTDIFGCHTEKSARDKVKIFAAAKNAR